MLLTSTTGVYLWTTLVLPPFLVDARAAAGLGALLAAGAEQPILYPASRRTPCGFAVAGEAAA